MAVKLYTLLICDNCGENITAVSGPNLAIDQARKNIHKFGGRSAVYDGRKIDLCMTCKNVHPAPDELDEESYRRDINSM